MIQKLFPDPYLDRKSINVLSLTVNVKSQFIFDNLIMKAVYHNDQKSVFTEHFVPTDGVKQDV